MKNTSAFFPSRHQCWLKETCVSMLPLSYTLTVRLPAGIIYISKAFRHLITVLYIYTHISF